MAKMSDIVSVIDEILGTNEVHTGLLQSVSFCRKQFAHLNITPRELADIFTKLEKARYIECRNSLSSPPSASFIFGERNVVRYVVKSARLLEYRKEIIEKINGTYSPKSVGGAGDKESNSEKTKIFISHDEGICRQDGKKKLQYPISGKKRPKLLWLLRIGKKSGPALVKSLEWDLKPLSQAIKEINDSFRKLLHLNDDLITSIDTGGYRINTNDFDVEWVDDEKR